MDLFKDLFNSVFGTKDEILSASNLKDVDLSNYTGSRTETYDRQGNIISIEDTRDLEKEKAKKIQAIREETGDKILKKAPLFKQLNALSGRLTDAEKTNLNDIINNLRNASLERKQKVLDAKNLDELDNI